MLTSICITLSPLSRSSVVLVVFFPSDPVYPRRIGTGSPEVGGVTSRTPNPLPCSRPHLGIRPRCSTSCPLPPVHDAVAAVSYRGYWLPSET